MNTKRENGERMKSENWSKNIIDLGGYHKFDRFVAFVFPLPSSDLPLPLHLSPYGLSPYGPGQAGSYAEMQFWIVEFQCRKSTLVGALALIYKLHILATIRVRRHHSNAYQFFYCILSAMEIKTCECRHNGSARYDVIDFPFLFFGDGTGGHDFVMLTSAIH